MSGENRKAGAARRWAPVLAIVAGLPMLLALPDAAGAGGLFGRAKPKAAVAPATMTFIHGTLKADLGGAWEVGGRKVTFGPAATVVLAGKLGDVSQLREGLEVTVMGVATSAGLVARICNATVPAPLSTRRVADEPGVEWSETDPTVGWGTRPN